ncbi:GAF and ANTAR domain-containing protein [Nocardia sp. NPDC052278]|uniref:GAF and ANTAR domain-containing protein n=1 Tax=unclassified Nocardia TaxID=2637762 RepID=UPI00369705F2
MTVRRNGVGQFDQLTNEFFSALEFLKKLSADGGAMTALCGACVRVLPVQRAAILIQERDAGLQPWATSDSVAARVEAVQATAGQGPAVDAAVAGVPVLVADLAETDVRWPGFADELNRVAVVAGSMVAVPLQMGVVRFGVLDLYRAEPGKPEPYVISAGLHIADLVIAQLVAGSAKSAHAAAQWWDQPLTSRTIHQAAGIVLAQLDIRAPDAYARLRAYAFAHGLSLAEVAALVVDDRLRFDT